MIAKIKKLHPNFKMPKQQTSGSVGLDLYACLDEDVVLDPGHRILIPVGFSMTLPESGDNFMMEAQIRPRSGLALKDGVTVHNAPGTIDGDYTGEIRVLLINLGTLPLTVQNGCRVAQMVFNYVPKVILMEIENLDATERGAGGFGSTGVT